MQPTLNERIREPFYHFAKKITGNNDVVFYIEPEDAGSSRPARLYFSLSVLSETDYGATQGSYVQEDETKKIGGFRTATIFIYAVGKGSANYLRRIKTLIRSDTGKILQDEEAIAINYIGDVMLKPKTDLEPSYIESAYFQAKVNYFNFEVDDENNEYIETINIESSNIEQG